MSKINKHFTPERFGAEESVFLFDSRCVISIAKIIKIDPKTGLYLFKTSSYEHDDEWISENMIATTQQELARKISEWELCELERTHRAKERELATLEGIIDDKKIEVEGLKKLEDMANGN